MAQITERQVRMIRPIPRSNDPTAIWVTYGWVPKRSAYVGRKYEGWKVQEVWGTRTRSFGKGSISNWEEA